MVNIRHINEELFYQIILVDFGNFDYIKFSKPLPISTLITTYFQLNGLDMTDAKEKIDKMVEDMNDCSEMLDDYFSIKINPNTASLEALPRLIKGHKPSMAYLPDLMYHLGTNVDWMEEEGCVRDMSTQLARFYARTPDKALTEDEYLNWSNIAEHLFFPLYKSLLYPSNQLTDRQTFHTVANITDLYKVFERC